MSEWITTSLVYGLNAIASCVVDWKRIVIFHVNILPVDFLLLYPRLTCDFSLKGNSTLCLYEGMGWNLALMILRLEEWLISQLVIQYCPKMTIKQFSGKRQPYCYISVREDHQVPYSHLYFFPNGIIHICPLAILFSFDFCLLVIVEKVEDKSWSPP